MQIIDMPGLMLRRAQVRRAQGRQWRFAAPVCVAFAVVVLSVLILAW